jgi:hypothetical protein
MHMQRKWSSGVLFSLLLTLSLAACSSGGGDSSNAAPAATTTGTAEGLWTGTLVDESTSDTRTVKGAVLDDGTYWFLYSAVGNPALMAGALQGDSSMQNGTFASSKGLDFSNELALILPVPVMAHYVMEVNLTGTVTYPGGKALTFTSTFDTEYNVVPVFANVAGTYEGSVFGFPHTITVDPSGAITVTTTVGHQSSPSGIELGCDFNGSLSTRSQGNVYNISFTPSNACTIAELLGRTFTGVAFFDAAAATKIYVLALHRRISPFDPYVFPFTGTKP